MRVLPFIYSGIVPKKNLIGKIAIAIIGLQLTRKAQATFVGKNRGYYIISTGDYMREKCRQNGLTVNSLNLHTVSHRIKENSILDEIIEGIKYSNEFIDSKVIIVDTIKTINGMRYLFQNFQSVYTVGFLASTTFRYEHSKLRKREDDPKNKVQFDKRDKKEIALGISDLIVFSDYFVKAGSIEDSRLQFFEILTQIENNDSI